ncbi:Ig-like domain-containing protein [Pseudomonas spelaei]
MIFSGRKFSPVASLRWNDLDIEFRNFRPASGGTSPYYYQSSTPSVASVTSQGVVRGLRGGVATITVTDSSSPAQTISYTVRSSIVVHQVLHNSSRLIGSESRTWIASVGGSYLPLTSDTLNDLRAQYSPGISDDYNMGSNSPDPFWSENVLLSGWSFGVGQATDRRETVCYRVI